LIARYELVRRLVDALARVLQRLQIARVAGQQIAAVARFGIAEQLLQIADQDASRLRLPHLGAGVGQPRAAEIRDEIEIGEEADDHRDGEHETFPGDEHVPPLGICPSPLSMHHCQTACPAGCESSPTTARLATLMLP
jgi:hypothetical protein